MSIRTIRALGTVLLLAVLVGASACTVTPGAATPTTVTSSTIAPAGPGSGPLGPDCVPLNFVHGANFGINCDLEHLTIDGADISADPPATSTSYGPEIWLTGSTFTNVNFSEANFKYSHLKGATFTDSNLSGIVLVIADLTNTTFTNVDLRGAQLGQATVTGATFSGIVIDSTTVCPDSLNWDLVDGCRGSLGSI